MSKFSLKDFFGNAFGDLLKSAGDAVDKIVTSKEEKLALQKEITEILTKAEATLDSEATERLRIDMTSDSWLSKNIRPLTLMFVTAVISVATFVDASTNHFVMNEAFLPLWETAFTTILIAYFGSRGVEKVFKTVSNGTDKKNKKDK